MFSSLMFLYIIVCFIGAALQSLCGFGFGIFTMSVLPHFFDSYPLVLALSTFSSLTISSVVVVREWRNISVKLIFPIIIGNITGISSVMLLWSGETHGVMKKFLGVFLILLSFYFIFLNKKFKIKPTFGAGITAGIIGGVSNAFFSMGGPPVVVYMLAASKNMKEYLASLQFYFIFSSVYVTTSRYMRGMIVPETIPMYFIALPFIALGIWTGLKLFGLLNEEKLRRVIYFFMAGSGMVMIVS